MKLIDLTTPALLLDLPKLDRNIDKMHQHLRKLGVSFRPHGKTAKNIDVMQRVLEREFGGITVSTVKEAEYYFDQGLNDLLYAVGIAPNKLDRLGTLVQKGAKIQLILDSIEQATFVAEKGQSLGFEFPVLIEIDCDGHRSGVQPEGTHLIRTGRFIDETPGINLAGILTHAGDSYGCDSTDRIRDMSHLERDGALRCAERLIDSGLPCPTISIGSTPTATFADDLTGVTEVRAGVYMTGDLVMAGLGVCRVEEIALSVLATVIGYQRDKGWIITDAGWMALSRDRGTAHQAVDQGYGLVCDIQGNPTDDLIMTGANQEHGILSQREGLAVDWNRYPIGSMIRILPNHACATSAMFDGYHVLDAHNNISAFWERCHGW